VRSSIEPDLFDNNVPFGLQFYHSDLSNQSALEIKVRVRLKSCTILSFFMENKENERLIFYEFHGR